MCVTSQVPPFYFLAMIHPYRNLKSLENIVARSRLFLLLLLGQWWAARMHGFTEKLQEPYFIHQMRC